VTGKHKALRLAIARQSDAVAIRAHAVSVERTDKGKALALVRFREACDRMHRLEELKRALHRLDAAPHYIRDEVRV
jgi:hypothetical protein